MAAMGNVIAESWNDVTVSPWHGRKIQEGRAANPIDNLSSFEAVFVGRKVPLSLVLPPPIDTILLDESTLRWSDPKGAPDRVYVFTVS